MIGQKNFDNWNFYLGIIALFSLLFLPDFSFYSSAPTIQAIDILLPLMAFLIFIQRDRFMFIKYYYWVMGYGAIILFSIFINKRAIAYIDYFEIYKVLKFLLVLSFFSLINFNKYISSLKYFFLGLVVVNLLHYYNIGDINYILETYYGGGVHIKYFGLNSLGEPAVKRMVGTMGNPNINGILFAFFTIGFLPLNYDKKMIPWFVSALLMMFLCQSRTIILAIGFTMLLVFVLQLSNWKLKHWSWIALMFSTYFVSWAMATDFFAYSLYSNSMFDAELMETRSAMGRFEVWNYLWQMVKNNPFWGHGPYKEYFYENQIYPENEYILILWRYGFIGLLSYFSLFALPAFWFMKNLKKDNLNKYGILLINLMLITATTNAPFTNRNIRVIFAMALGLIFSEIYKKHLHSENQ